MTKARTGGAPEPKKAGNPRLAAARALVSVFESGSYSNLVLEPYFEREKFSLRDRGFCTALFYGVLERSITLDWALGQYSKTPLKKLDPPVLQMLRLGAYQLLYMPTVPRSAAVNESVALAKPLGQGWASGFVNGVLRGFVRGELAYTLPKDKLTALSVEYSVPAPLIRLWRNSYGHEAALEILRGSLGPAPVFARVNTLRTTPEGLLCELEKEGVAARRVPAMENALELLTPGNIPAIPAFAQGLFHVQDLSSQLCAAALDARPGMEVLDLCAAPGGKTFTIAQGMEDRGRILACDLYPQRLGLVEEGAARLGLSILETRQKDAREFDSGLGQFDRVLCDVVCSGYGILRRKPEIRYKPLEILDGISDTQYNILCTASQYLKTGGRLLYSTCTLNPGENQEVVERFLGEHPEFALLAPMRTLIHGRDGLDCDGFFMALLGRK